MLIDGEKWACEACVRGHRVSNCQHADRPLQHINKKGRPVSQCQHCRTLRKSRSSHVKCDCGEKSHKCSHLQAPFEGHKESCCCNHGGRCTCALKKEQSHLDTVPESDSENEASVSIQASSVQAAVRGRRRAKTIHSDGFLTFDENGHHRPVHKHAKASHKNGPYQLHRVNSVHSTSSLANRSMDNLLHGHGIGCIDAQSISGSLSSSSGGLFQEKRQTKSEAASPRLAGASDLGSLGGLQPLDLSGLEYPSYMANGFDIFGNLSDHEQPMFGSGLSTASVDWSHYDGLDFGASRSTENFAPSSYSQAQSFGCDYNGSELQPPTLTTSNSGEVSEVEDFMATTADDLEPAFGRQSNSSSCFNLGAMAGASTTGLMDAADLSGIDYDDFLSMKNKFLPTPTSMSGDEPSSLMAATSAPGALNVFSSLEDDTTFWMGGDYNQGLAVASATSDPDDVSFWDAQ